MTRVSEVCPCCSEIYRDCKCNFEEVPAGKLPYYNCYTHKKAIK